MDSQLHTKWKGSGKSQQPRHKPEKQASTHQRTAGLDWAELLSKPLPAGADASCTCFLAGRPQGKACWSWVLCWRT